ncbi:MULTISPECIES: hypothetical protein [unclassified Rhodococcus (in: high G+C Gram-positive bacteria)]|uniref:hypothetical protein n=1 Tax=unclassified Rhodococcus (in: high G+C Gram-positive bacteria) TaxID=192944 RepID=UPI00163A4DE1|nr:MULTISPECIES: hypothetical protein [unclassified Rhodococcus (in: high G+C Gram-positive bacteria)]MBC2644609.1 hypothetical protein [Rhodococcus sp. 3A]MBC2890947.1 hypothetical protein [Rhodococcus sp. 4CII]MBC2897708.1 hypothetical protein [Rhodococcus sp. 4CII]
MPTLMLDALVAAAAVTLRLCLPESVRVSMTGLSRPAEKVRMFPLFSVGYLSADDSWAQR